MKKYLTVILLTIMAVAFIGCKTEPDPCNLGAHLGIGETCTGTSCTLQDYRTEEQKLTFPKEINRYGKASNYTAQELRTTTDNIVMEFVNIKNAFNPTEYSAIMAKIVRLCVAQAENNMYIWDGVTFGVDPDVSSGFILSRAPRVAEFHAQYPLAHTNPVPGLSAIQPVAQ